MHTENARMSVNGGLTNCHWPVIRCADQKRHTASGTRTVVKVAVWMFVSHSSYFITSNICLSQQHAVFKNTVELYLTSTSFITTTWAEKKMKTSGVTTLLA